MLSLRFTSFSQDKKTRPAVHNPEPDNAALDLQAIASRLRQMLTTAAMDGIALAAKTGIPYGTTRAYFSGIRPPSPEFLVACYRSLGVLPSWVLTGDAPMTRDSDLPPKVMGHDLVPIYRVNLDASAGHGAVNDARGEYITDVVCVSRTWLSGRGLGSAKLRALRVHGDSMKGVLEDGDLVVIDMDDVKPRSGFAYVLRHSDELLVKYCEVMPGSRVRVSSANPAFGPYDIDLERTSDFAIIGRVVASMHDW